MKHIEDVLVDLQHYGKVIQITDVLHPKYTLFLELPAQYENRLISFFKDKIDVLREKKQQVLFHNESNSLPFRYMPYQ